MEESIPSLVPIKKAAEILGCSDKVIRNYIKDGKINFQTVSSPYGDQYEVDPEEVKAVYNSRRSATLEIKKFQSRPEYSSGENPLLKEIIPTLEGFRSDYKEAMERISLMSYELGTTQKEVKLLTGDSLEKSAMEKQIQALLQQVATLETEKKALETRLEELNNDKLQLQNDKTRLEESLENERSKLEQELKKSVWQKLRGG